MKGVPDFPYREEGPTNRTQQTQAFDFFQSQFLRDTTIPEGITHPFQLAANPQRTFS